MALSGNGFWEIWLTKKKEFMNHDKWEPLLVWKLEKASKIEDAFGHVGFCSKEIKFN